MSEHVFLLTIGLPLATILIIFGMKYFASIQQAKARLANDEAYRLVAAQASAAQAETAAALASIQAALADLKKSVASVETILRQVD